MGSRKGGDEPFLYAAAALLFLALCAWTGAELYGRLHRESPPPRERSETAGLLLEGIALRRERPVCAPEPVELLTTDGERLAAGSALLLSGGEMLVCEGSAVWFSDWDGLEYLSPDSLGELTPQALRALLESPPDAPADERGRLVEGRDWYFAALTDGAVRPGERCRLLFEGLDRPLPARVTAVSAAERGQRALLLRLTEGGADCLSLRRCRAMLLREEETQIISIEKEG